MSDPLVQIPFAGGPDESTDPRQLPPGSIVAAFNTQYDQDGAYLTRYGYTMLPNPPSSVFRLAVFAFELVVFTLAGACLSFSGDESAFVQRDAAAPIGVTHAPLTNSSTGFNSWGFAIVGGVRVVAWTDAQDNFPRAAVYDQISGTLLLSTQLSSQNSTNVHVGGIGNTAMVIVADGGAANIRAFTLNTSSIGSGWSGPVLISDANYASTSGLFTAAWSATLLTIAYEHTGGGNSSLQAIGYNAALTQQFDVSNGLPAGTSAFFGLGSRITDSENYWAYIYASNTGFPNNVFAVRMNPATGVASTSFALGFNTAGANGAMQLASARVDSTHEIVTVSDGINAWTLKVTTAGVVGGSTVEMFHMRTASAPAFVTSLGTAFSLWADPHTSSSQSYYLVDLLAGSTGAMPQLLSVLAPGIVSLNSQPTLSLSFPAVPWSVDAAGNFEVVAPIDVTSNVRQGLELFTAAVTPGFLGSNATLGKEGYFSGLRYDGRMLVENGFAQQPTVSVSNSGGAGSTYQYVVTMGWIDAHGNLEESAPCPVQSIVSGAPPNTVVTINTTGISRKHRTPLDPTAGKMVFIVYRTQALASGDTSFYRVTQEPFTLVNNPAASTVTFADTTSDATLTDGTHPVFYAVSGELAHNTPETFTHITGHVQRIWGIGADQRTIWYSQQYVDGVIPAWSNLFQVSVDDAGEPLVALASLYDKLLVFTQTKIFVLYGQGPAINGTGNDLQSPQRVPSAAGCIEPRSIVNTPLGVMFQSQRGLELIGPDLSVTFIGQPISKTTATYPICTSAAIVEPRNVVRFTLTNAVGQPNAGNGVIAQFDLRHNRWAIHQVTCGGTRGNVAGAPMQSAVAHPTHIYYAAHNDNASASLVYVEDPSTYLDFSSFFVPLTVQTAWIKGGDLQGWQSVRRVRLLCSYGDSHGLSVSFAYDYQGFTEAAHVFTDTQIGNLRNGSYEQVMFVPGPGRRCEAIQVLAVTVAPTVNPVGTGQGAGFVGLAFEIQPKKGGYRKIPTAARA